MTVEPTQRVLLLGGTSEIGLAIVRRLAADGPVVPHLAGRDAQRLAAALADLEADGCHAGGTVIPLDAREPATHEAAIAQAFDAAGGIDVVIVAVGVLGGQAGPDADPGEALEVMEVGFAGTGSMVLAAVRALRRAGGGALIVLSSVAAERPRAANPIYGAAKAGLDALAQGLADATAGTAVRVLVVRPGFVRTKMTAGLKPAAFATTPDAVAEATRQGLRRGAHTVWVPGVLRYVFMILRHLPRPLFRRLPL